MSWAIFNALKQLLWKLIHASSSFIDLDGHFKALKHFPKLQLGKVLFAQYLIH